MDAPQIDVGGNAAPFQDFHEVFRLRFQNDHIADGIQCLG